MKRSASNKVVAAKPSGNLPAVYGEDAGLGFENQSQSDYKIPFLAILQSNSPQVQEDGIPGAKPGMIFNTVTGDIYKGSEGVVVLASTTQHRYVEWVPRDAGGGGGAGFVGVYDTTDPKVVAALQQSDTKFGKQKIGTNDLVETYYVYGVQILPDGKTTPVVIGFSSTKIKKYQGWMTKAKMLGYPLPALQYRLTTVKEKNKKGEFYNWSVALIEDTAEKSAVAPDSTFYRDAKALNLAVNQGLAKADMEGAAKTGDAQGQESGEDIPF